MSSFCIHGAQVLFGQNLQETDLNVHQGKVVGERVGHVLDGRHIAEEYIPIFQTLLVTVYGAYFVGRSWEKAKSITSKNT